MEAEADVTLVAVLPIHGTDEIVLANNMTSALLIGLAQLLALLVLRVSAGASVNLVINSAAFSGGHSMTARRVVRVPACPRRDFLGEV